MGDSSISPPSLRIRLLGSFEVEVDGVRVADGRWRRRGARRLVKLLALVPNFRLRREQAIEALWPENSALAGGNNLNNASAGYNRSASAGPVAVPAVP